MDKITATVLFDGKEAGKLTRDDRGYSFRYLKGYLTDSKACPISTALPLTTKTFTSQRLFPFFESLVSEGWLLEIQSRTQRIDKTDYFTLLVENGEDLVGAVSVVKQR